MRPRRLESRRLARRIVRFLATFYRSGLPGASYGLVICCRSPYGPHRPELLESALARPQQAVAYAAADGILQSAYLFHGLLMNHGFVQGNKRTAYAILEWFLQANAVGRIKATDDQVVEFCLNAENDKWSVEQVDAWLRAHIAAESVSDS